MCLWSDINYIKKKKTLKNYIKKKETTFYATTEVKSLAA